MRVGLDADEVVNEFCRLFPEWGDRRAERVIREKAQIIAHDLDWEDLPAPQQRRASDRAASAAPGFFGRHRARLLAHRHRRVGRAGPGLCRRAAGFRLLALGRRRGRVVLERRHVLPRPPLRPRRLRVDLPDAAVDARRPAGSLSSRTENA